ncbi:hypothetical protein M1555_02110 [Patescibacteria group bacterium]|nr:hypothetical protein [Patescibacteria group bacterium]
MVICAIVIVVSLTKLATSFIDEFGPDIQAHFTTANDLESTRVANARPYRNLGDVAELRMNTDFESDIKWMTVGYVAKSDLKTTYKTDIGEGYSVLVNNALSFQVDWDGTTRFTSSKIYPNRAFQAFTGNRSIGLYRVEDTGSTIQVEQGILCGKSPIESYRYPDAGLVYFAGPGCSPFSPPLDTSSWNGTGYVLLSLSDAKLEVGESGVLVLTVDNFEFRFPDSKVPALLQARIDLAKVGQPDYASLEVRFTSVYRMNLVNDGQTQAWDISFDRPSIIWSDGHVLYVDPSVRPDLQ